MYKSASTYASNVDWVFAFIMGISLVMLLMIVAFMVYCVFRFDKKRNPTATDIEGNMILETAWTVIPTIIVLVMFYYGWKEFLIMITLPNDNDPNVVKVDVASRQWSWYFEYSNDEGGRKGSAILRAPINKPVKLKMESQDVLHSLYVPAFRMKQDTVPGMTTYMWFEATEKGEFDIICAEYCGDDHSYMMSKVMIMDEKDFREWVNAPIPPEELGKELFEVKGGCIKCHTLDGKPHTGPTLKGIFGRKEKVAIRGKGVEEITVDEEYLKRSMFDPQADVVVGYEKVAMPSQAGLLSDDEVSALIEYLKTIK